MADITLQKILCYDELAINITQTLVEALCSSSEQGVSQLVTSDRAVVITERSITSDISAGLETSGASTVKVTLSDSSVYEAKVIGKDREKDVAVLQLSTPKGSASQLTPVVVGSSSNLLVGQKVGREAASAARVCPADRVCPAARVCPAVRVCPAARAWLSDTLHPL